MTFEKTHEEEPEAPSAPAPEVDMDEELYKLLNGS